MDLKYRYKVNGTGIVNVRGLDFYPDKYRYSNVPLLSSADLAANPTISVDTDLNLTGTFTLGADSIAPANVTSLVGAVHDSAIVLTWVDPISVDLDHIEITASPSIGTVNVAKGVQTKNVTGLTNATPYTFTVKSVDGTGNKSAGVVIAKTPVDSTPPAEVTSLNVQHNDSELMLTWVDPADADFNHVEITGTPTIGGTKTFVKGKQTGILHGLTNGTSYSLTIKTVDNLGNKSTGLTIQGTPLALPVDTTPAAEVTGLSVVDAGGHIARLTWTDPTTADLDHIEISWNSKAGGAVQVLPGVQTYSTPVLTPGTFTFTVKTSDFVRNLSTGVVSAATPIA